jgi:hypothetical protein
MTWEGFPCYRVTAEISLLPGEEEPVSAQNADENPFSKTSHEKQRAGSRSAIRPLLAAMAMRIVESPSSLR